MAHDCDKTEAITTHEVEINNIKDIVKDLTVKVNKLEEGFAANCTCISNIDTFIADYKQREPESRGDFKKVIYTLIGNVVLIFALMAGYMAYQNNMVVRLQEENKKIILRAIATKQPNNNNTQ